jgi:hypothetical protein
MTALETVSFPAATSISQSAFALTGSKSLTVTPGSTAPAPGYSIFGVSESKTVTVKVPAGGSGYGVIPSRYTGSNSTSNRGNGFRGGGWTGSAFKSYGGINTGIILNIEYISP